MRQQQGLTVPPLTANQLTVVGEIQISMPDTQTIIVNNASPATLYISASQGSSNPSSATVPVPPGSMSIAPWVESGKQRISVQALSTTNTTLSYPIQIITTPEVLSYSKWSIPIVSTSGIIMPSPVASEVTVTNNPLNVDVINTPDVIIANSSPIPVSLSGSSTGTEVEQVITGPGAFGFTGTSTQEAQFIYSQTPYNGSYPIQNGVPPGYPVPLNILSYVVDEGSSTGGIVYPVTPFTQLPTKRKELLAISGPSTIYSVYINTTLTANSTFGIDLTQGLDIYPLYLVYCDLHVVDSTAANLQVWTETTPSFGSSNLITDTGAIPITEIQSTTSEHFQYIGSGSSSLLLNWTNTSDPTIFFLRSTGTPTITGTVQVATLALI